MKLEVELKLSLDPAEWQLLCDALGKTVGVVEQTNRYYEDAGDPLLWSREGYSIRLREVSGAWTLTVKGAGEVDEGWSSRPEWERALPREGIEAILAGGDALLLAVRDLVGELPPALLASQLTLRGEMRNLRRSHRVDELPELVELDRFTLPDGSIHHELELELDGDDAAKRKFATAHLRFIFANLGIEWRASILSKRERFERALTRAGEQ